MLLFAVAMPGPAWTAAVNSRRTTTTTHFRPRFSVSSVADGLGFPSFLPKEVEGIKDPYARKLASRIQRLPVTVGSSGDCIMSSCVMPLSSTQSRATTSPMVLLHGFDSSCLEWRYALPQLEEAGLEAWAVDVLGWGFSDLGLFCISSILLCMGSTFNVGEQQLTTLFVFLLFASIFGTLMEFLEKLPPCNVQTKREHLHQLWKTYIRRPIILVGPSLGAAIAIDFAVQYPEAVEKLVLIDASVYAEGTGGMATLPRTVAYAGVYLLKSALLRLFFNALTFDWLPLSTSIDWMNIGRLHCTYHWWADATVNFMRSGGYDVARLIPKINQKTLIIWGEDDKIISSKLGVRLHCELPNAIIRQIPNCGHIPHVEKPSSVAKLIKEFVQDQEDRSRKEDQLVGTPVS
ncbi:unnamed protein product [Linum tenue]|uniref:AB hydrolase-1 domain-containing protein n=1 Tax=Linum tenue TaxID=586396 RepID=A0AAV0I012_9ROSI|nr:unnamed protein product [Linum tenue]